MVEFLKKNLVYIPIILSIISVLFSYILLRLKKVPLKRLLKIIEYVPVLINEVEELFPLSSMGAVKKQYVMQLCDDLLAKYGLQKYRTYIDFDKLIEDFLSTPTRKEVISDVKTKKNVKEER